jgi:starvation-inducible DNA-binding protein
MMATKTLNPTRHDLPQDSRLPLIDLLNARLADMADYASQLKQAHWNIKGMQFVALHEMLDSFHAEAAEWSDMLAERAVMLGGIAEGTVKAAARQSTLPDYPLEETGATEHLTALADGLGKLGKDVRTAIAKSEEHGDADTADLFTEISRGLDKQLWYFDAHLTS